MSQIPAATAATAGATQSAKSAEPSNPNGSLTQNDFLKLMVAQMQAQNPLQPEGNTGEYMNEISTFTEVEQITALTGQSALSSGVQLIGHEVTYNDKEGVPQTGTVESIQTTSSGATLTIDGTPGISELSVTEVS
ncbi:MAG TPA: flagellar hook capping FlgD N-terminal domain-containing protein [Solirubrobacteraceae bacterium]|jgi:flagellar basal-body rod modification protein FlgD